MLWVSSSLLEAYSPASNSRSLTAFDPQIFPVLSIAILSLNLSLLSAEYISRAVLVGKWCFWQEPVGLIEFLIILYQGHNLLRYFRV
jgi:hypothetical protein